MNPDLWVYRARPVRVIDGDTIVVDIDHGMHVFTSQSLRLKDVDCPELYRGSDEEKAAGRAARAFVQEWLAARTGAWPLFVNTYKDRQSFNRYVADVWDVDGNSLAVAIVDAGHGSWV